MTDNQLEKILDLVWYMFLGTCLLISALYCSGCESGEPLLSERLEGTRWVAADIHGRPGLNRQYEFISGHQATNAYLYEGVLTSIDTGHWEATGLEVFMYFEDRRDVLRIKGDTLESEIDRDPVTGELYRYANE